jgi:hypothetical protein
VELVRDLVHHRRARLLPVLLRHGCHRLPARWLPSPSLALAPHAAAVPVLRATPATSFSLFLFSSPRRVRAARFMRGAARSRPSVGPVAPGRVIRPSVLPALI